LVRSGLDESLAGRFEVIPIRHWSQTEMFDGFGFDAEAFIFFGGYPGAASLRQDEDRWARYMRDAIIETTLGRDVLAMERIQKPALLRSVFHLACSHGGEILSYTKMQGQLQDAGNTVTLAHYLELLSRAGLVMGLSKHCGAEVRSRASSPKLLPLDTGLMSALAGRSFQSVRADGEAWGRLAEVAVGAHLVRGLFGSGAEVKYWRDVNLEVDYVVTRAGRVTAIEVTTSRRKGSLPGMTAFTKQFPVDRQLLVGGQGIPLAEFLSRPPEHWCA
jgi:predicted AAA+ superfamily ATPase